MSNIALSNLEVILNIFLLDIEDPIFETKLIIIDPKTAIIAHANPGMMKSFKINANAKPKNPSTYLSDIVSRSFPNLETFFVALANHPSQISHDALKIIVNIEYT